MKVLKGLVLSLLSFLLFMSLSVFGIAFTLNSTLLDANFVVSEVDKMDMPAVARGLTDMVQLPPEVQFLKGAIDSAAADFAPSIKEQLKTGINSSYDYFLGKSPRLSLTISLEPLKTGLRDRMRQAFMQSIPAQLSGLPQAQVDQYFNQLYQQITQPITSSLFKIDESSAQIRQVKQHFDYFQLGYKALIGFMLLLILGIILINRQVKKITRELGVNFLLYGALGYLGAFQDYRHGSFLPLVLGAYHGTGTTPA